MLSKQDKANLVFKILLHRSKSKEVYSSISSMKNPLSMLSIKNYDNIDWLLLSSNPNAIQLLEERVKYQLGLNGQQLNDLSIHKRINWQKLSSNPAIFVLNKNPSI